ncbi:MAG: RHS domain-containing protein [Deltaproteobacteria bacterium]|nr:RHS domain-containing protein [Deltaproteobacteria bacterium]
MRVVTTRTARGCASVVIAWMMLAVGCGDSAPRTAADASSSSDTGSENRRDGSTALDGSPADGSPTADAGVSTQDAGPLGGDVGSGGARDSGADGGGEAMPVDWPDDESQPPPPIDPAEPYDIVDATRFIYEGDNPIQTGVEPGTIKPSLVAVIRGRVVNDAGDPISHVVVKIVDRPEFGQSRTKRDGFYEIAINGGETVNVSLSHADYLPLMRPVTAAWKSFELAPDVIMTALDAAATQVTLSTLTATIGAVVAEGTPMTDVDGARTARIVLEPGLSASMQLPDGMELPLNTITVRATEYTVGDDGAEKMPAPLPPSSMYTYAVELSVDEAMAMDASTVLFSQPVPVYVDNFLDVPVGEIVPVGTFDRECGCWVPSENGRVLKVLDIDLASGRARLDVDGEGVVADSARLSELGISAFELRAIPGQFEVGQSFWRAETSHFTPMDFNWGGSAGCSADCDPGNPGAGGSPPGCAGSGGAGAAPGEGGSIIDCESRALNEVIAIPGTDLSLVYSTRNVEGYKQNRRLDLALTRETIPPTMRSVEMVLAVAGQRVKRTFAPEANLRHAFDWDGLDAWGRPVNTQTLATIKLGYRYPVSFSRANREAQRAFMESTNATIDFDRETSTVVLERTFSMFVGPGQSGYAEGEPARAQHVRKQSIGGWSVSGHQELSSSVKKALEAADDPTAPFWTSHAAPETAFAMIFKDDGSRQEINRWGARQPRLALTYTDLKAATDHLGLTLAQGASFTLNEHFDGVGPRARAVVTPAPDGGFYFWAQSYQTGGVHVDTQAVLVRRHGDGVVEYVGGGAGLADETGGGAGTCTHRIPEDELPHDGVPARDVCFSHIAASRVGPGGALYIGTHLPNRIYRMDMNHRVFHVAGSATGTYEGGEGPAESTGLGQRLGALAIGADCTLYVADACYILRITPDGLVHPFFGRQPEAPVRTLRVNYPGVGGEVLSLPECQAQPIYPTEDGTNWPVAAIRDVEVAGNGTVYVNWWNDVGWSRIDAIDTAGRETWVSASQWDVSYPYIPMRPGYTFRMAAFHGRIALSARDELLLYDNSAHSATYWADFFVLRDGVTELVARVPRTPLAAQCLNSYGVISPNGDVYCASALGDGVVVDVGVVSSEVVDANTGRIHRFNPITLQHERTTDPLTGVATKRFAYDSALRLTGVLEPTDATTTIERDASSGRAAAIVAPTGERSQLAYGADGYLAGVTLPGGGQYQMAYDKGGLLTRFEQPSGRVSTLTYDAEGALVEDRDSAGQGWTISKEPVATADAAFGHRVRMARPGGDEKSYTLEKLNDGAWRRTTTDFDGSTRVQTFAPMEVNTTYPDGTTEKRTLAPDPRHGMDAPYVSRLEMRTPGSNQVVSMTRSRTVEFATNGDPLSPLKKQTDTVTFLGRTVTQVFDADSRVLSDAENGSGLKRSVSLDERGLVTSVALTDIPSGNHRDSRFAYTEAGQIESIDGERTDVEDVSRFGYDASQRLTMATNAAGHRFEVRTYDAAGRPTHVLMPAGLEHRFAYDARGHLSEWIAGAGEDPGVRRTTRFTFDPSTKRHTVVTPRGTSWISTFGGSEEGFSELRAPSGERIVYLEALANKSAQLRLLDAAGHEHASFEMAYDSGRRMMTTRDGSEIEAVATEMDPFRSAVHRVVQGSRVSAFEYDNAGSITEYRTPSGARYAFSGTTRQSMTTIDPVNRRSVLIRGPFLDVVSFEDASAGATHYAYDEAGRLSSMTDARGVSLSIVRDVLGRAIAYDYPGSVDDVSLTYDEPPNGIGRLTSVRDSSGTTSLSYNVFGQVVERREVIGDVSLSVQYTYDEGGALSSITYPSGVVVHMTRDELGRVVSISARTLGAGSDVPIVSNATYLPFGPVARFVMGDTRSTAHSRSYDLGYRNTGIEITGVVDWQLGYDAYGFVDEVAEDSTAFGTRTQTLEIDLDGRLVSASDPRTYGDLRYTYNAVGDRLTSQTDSQAAISYTYDGASGRLTSMATAGEAAVVVEYDAAGNATRLGDLALEYSASGRLTRARASGAGLLEASYVYNSRDERVAKTVHGTGGSQGGDGDTTLFVYDETTRLLGEYSGSGEPVREMIWLGSLPVASIEFAERGEVTVYWIHADHLNTPRFMTDAAGRVVWSWQSDPFGSTLPNEDPDGDGTAVHLNLRFPGQFFDAETGFHENHARVYDPRVGRYLQVEPVRGVASASRYAYASNRPLEAMDPDGRSDTTAQNENLAVLREVVRRYIQDATEGGDRDPDDLANAKRNIADIGLLLIPGPVPYDNPLANMLRKNVRAALEPWSKYRICAEQSGDVIGPLTEDPRLSGWVFRQVDNGIPLLGKHVAVQATSPEGEVYIVDPWKNEVYVMPPVEPDMPYSDPLDVALTGHIDTSPMGSLMHNPETPFKNMTRPCESCPKPTRLER